MILSPNVLMVWTELYTSCESIIDVLRSVSLKTTDSDERRKNGEIAGSVILLSEDVEQQWRAGSYPESRDPRS